MGSKTAPTKTSKFCFGMPYINTRSVVVAAVLSLETKIYTYFDYVQDIKKQRLNTGTVSQEGGLHPR